MSATITTVTLSSPLGTIIVGADAATGRISLCHWADSPSFPKVAAALERAGLRIAEPTADSSSYPLLLEACSQIRQYLCGERRQFSLSILACGTPFRRRVWDMLSTIPYGTTLTYSDAAAAIGRPEAVRAVASAIAANPINIIIPCHRVTTVGALGGYSGGVEAKKHLLMIERSGRVGHTLSGV